MLETQTLFGCFTEIFIKLERSANWNQEIFLNLREQLGQGLIKRDHTESEKSTKKRNTLSELQPW
jgi:hypothetical protein